MSSECVNVPCHARLMEPLTDVLAPGATCTPRDSSIMDPDVVPQFSIACRSYSELRSVYQIHEETVVEVNVAALCEWHFMRPVNDTSEKYEELLASVKVS